ncbi:MAG: NADH-quinone oxidoreductase subunit C [Desulfovibrio sp.]|jgi:NADH-quinone oxidoreductase subunit C|nr:NADH-quinone oxidoreductase subunit C [Desulfovibrio sp.]
MPGRYLQHLPKAIVARMDEAKTGLALSAIIPVEALHEAAALMDGLGYFLEDVTGVHVAEGFELDYCFAHWTRPGRVCLCIVAPASQPEAPTISDIFPGADWHERETADFLGVRFVGHPNPQPLLMPEDSLHHPLLREKTDLRSIHALLPQQCFINGLPETLDLPRRTAPCAAGGPSGSTRLP